MKVNREQLEKILEDFISTYAKDRKTTSKVINELEIKNILAGDVKSIFALSSPVSTLSKIMLYLFTKALFNATKDDKINPNKFFTELEIQDGDKWKQEVKEVSKYPIVFEKSLRLSDSSWLTTITAQQANDLFNSQAVMYNPKTQRPLKRSIKNDRIIEKIDVNPKSVQEIHDNLINDDFLANCITINILADGNEEFAIDPESGTVTIFAGELDLVDGFHRYRGMMKAVQSKPDINYISGVILTHYDLDKAKHFVHQESKHNPLNKEYAKSIAPKISNEIVHKLNTSTKSYLKGKITTDPIYIKTGNALVMFNTLADSIDLTFNSKTPKDLLKHSTVIQQGINSIIEVKQEILDNSIDDKFWAFYMALIFNLHTHENYIDRLQEIVTKDHAGNIEMKALNQKHFQKLNEYIKSLI